MSKFVFLPTIFVCFIFQSKDVRRSVVFVVVVVGITSSDMNAQSTKLDKTENTKGGVRRRPGGWWFGNRTLAISGLSKEFVIKFERNFKTFVICGAAFISSE